MVEHIYKDTSNIFSIDRGDIIEVSNRRYIVTGNERERRFGVDDPKFWVKRVRDQETGVRKIIKLSFYETFDTVLGGVRIKRFRNPDKEGAILQLVKDHPSFMQGTVHRDSKGNNIRILDIVWGKNFFVYIDELEVDHEKYFFTELPEILKKIVKCCEAIRFLHINGFRHGDIRNDHIIIERDTGEYVWIDFDYDYDGGENPFGLDIFGLGNIMLYAIGKGFHHFHSIKNSDLEYASLQGNLNPEDFSILDKGRFINLRKLYPYIPTILNDILAHFSRGSEVFYESVEEIVEDINRSLYFAFRQ